MCLRPYRKTLLESSTMSRYLTSLSLALIFSSACAGPNSATKPAASAELKKAPAPVKLAAGKGKDRNDPNELICTFERDTGTMIPTKTCRTRWQMEEDRRQVEALLSQHSAQSVRGQ